jgi:membrane protein DedA with SNARE-associated domain
VALSSQDPHVEAPPRALHWQIMLPVCILGVVISDGLLYGMGRIFGRRMLKLPFMARLLPSAKRERIEENFHKYGVLVLLFARFLPAIRSPIFIMAGVMRLPLTRFLIADGIYAIPGVSLLFFLAFWFGDQFRDLVMRAEGRVEKLRPLIILLLIAGVTGYLVSHFLRHPVATGDPREEVPLVGDRVAETIEHPTKPEDKSVPESNR